MLSFIRFNSNGILKPLAQGPHPNMNSEKKTKTRFKSASFYKRHRSFLPKSTIFMDSESSQKSFIKNISKVGIKTAMYGDLKSKKLKNNAIQLIPKSENKKAKYY